MRVPGRQRGCGTPCGDRQLWVAWFGCWELSTDPLAKRECSPGPPVFFSVNWQNLSSNVELDRSSHQPSALRTLPVSVGLLDSTGWRRCHTLLKERPMSDNRVLQPNWHVWRSATWVVLSRIKENVCSHCLQDFISVSALCTEIVCFRLHSLSLSLSLVVVLFLCKKP